MSLLDNLKNNSNTNGENNMTNPLLAALAASQSETQEQAPQTNPLLAALAAKQEPKEAAPAEQTNPLLAALSAQTEAPAEEAVKEAPVQEDKEEKVAEAPVAPPAPVEPPKEEEAASAPEPEAPVAQEPVKEEAPKQEKSKPEPKKDEAPKEEKPKEEPKKEETPKEEAPKEEKPKTRAKSRTKSSSQTESKAETIEVPRTKTGFDQVLSSIKSQFVDAAWEEFKQTVQNELGEIIISQDMNPGTLKITLQELSIIREKIWTPLQEYKAQYENMASREPEGLIEQIKRINVSGSNEMDRRKAGVMAVMHHKAPDGTEMNLYEVTAELRDRYGFLRAAMEHVTYKTNALITMNGALKLENSHIQ